MEEKREEKNISLKFININFRLHGLIFLLAFSFILFLASGIRGAEAASLYLSPSSGSYEAGGSFSVSIYTSSTDQAMNAVSGSVSFPGDKLEVASLSKSGSIVSLWVVEPSFSNGAGTVNFEGIVLNPGYIGSGGKILTITFKTKATGSASLKFSSGSILANDGLGTNILTGMGSGSYSIVEKSGAEVKMETPTAAKEVAEPADSQTKAEVEQEEAEEGLAPAPAVASPTHPDQSKWYKDKNAQFKWDLPFGTTGVSILLNDKPFSNPGPVSDGLFSSRKYDNLDDGIWYLHLKLKDNSGWSKIAHYRVQIDSVPPDSFDIDVADSEEGWPVLVYKAFDSASGIEKYEVKINEQKFEARPDSDRFDFPALPPGSYTAVVKAIDRASNEAMAAKDFTIKPIEGPEIRYYTKELTTRDQYFIIGTAPANASVNVFIRNQGSGKIISKSVKSDDKGIWYLVGNNDFPNSGNYIVSAVTVNRQGMQSLPSNFAEIKVKTPAPGPVGLPAASFLLLIVIILLVIIIVKNKKRGKKEITKKIANEAENIGKTANKILKK